MSESKQAVLEVLGEAILAAQQAGDSARAGKLATAYYWAVNATSPSPC